MAEKSLVWKGKAVTSRMRAAQIEGVNRTMGACVRHAKDNHPWKNRTGILEGDIQIAEFAHEDGKGVEGIWGVRGESKQALILELGGVIVPVEAKALKFQLPDGSWRIVKSVTIPAYPYLRPAADVNYPDLPANIKKAWDKYAPGSPAPGGGNA